MKDTRKKRNVARLKAQSVEFAKLLEGQKGDNAGSKGQ
jgi:hypothetical protein